MTRETNEFRTYVPELGRWVNRDPIGEAGGLNPYALLDNNGLNRVDLLGLVWVWGPESASYFPIAFDPAMRRPAHGPPVAHVSGTGIAEALARALGGLNDTLFQHYLHGGGHTYDLTGSALIKGEVEAALSAIMHREHLDIVRDAEMFACPTSGGIFGFSSHTIGDTAFSPITRVPFTSSVWVIRSATAGLSKKTNARILCCNGRLVGAFVKSEFKMYYYDRFADAPDPAHWISGAQEFIGGTQFDEIGAWGKQVEQLGIKR